MGVSQSKSQLERRNTLERRSQRRSIHNIRSRLEKLFIDIKKFDGVEEDEEYDRIMNQIDRMRREMMKKKSELQPQVRNIYQKTLRALDDAQESLEDQLEDNQEYFRERQDELKERRLRLEEKSGDDKQKDKKDLASSKDSLSKKSIQRKKVMSDTDQDDEIEEKPRRLRNRKKDPDEGRLQTRKNSFTKRRDTRTDDSEDDDIDDDDSEAENAKAKQRGRRYSRSKSMDDILYEDIEMNHGNARNESEKLAKSTDRRKTVELNFVKVVPSEETANTQVEVHNGDEPVKEQKTQSEKRKSILKMGIPVIPSAMMNLISRKSKKISVQYSDEVKDYTSDELLKKVKEIITELEEIECQIADFVGKRNGPQYNRFKLKLNGYLVELSQLNTTDDYVLEQIKLCRNYVSSCMNFLDEKSTDDQRYDSRDDVFLPGTTSPRPMSPINAQEKLQKLSKTTAI